jgi:hypothetical protein
MNVKIRTLEEIRLVGLEALARELGPVEMVRFLQQFETGHGDYSTERHRWLGNPDVRTLAGRIRQQRGESEPQCHS